ncbi:MAG TPA: helix-turn-helix domain-containing protein [Candidatus Saccharimonadales bacterium]|jgi:DNA-binding HxlR family transcriptional regulator|nr:helix-turn-helix domain-containing protein [Candidatus Saccharimonadales bacterium]
MQIQQLNQSKIEKHPGCIAEALSIIGNKWTALLVMELAKGNTRFCHIETSLKGISPRTLSQRLDYLADKSIITKQNFQEMPPRVEYTLTKKGYDLLPILQSMASWGNKYYQN